ncbi:sigma-54-dependent Fis family transcriptional regulator [Nitrospina watsonii]|uniref:Transcriptional regulator, sigma54-dependent n=1 Tax=Nitrospina watsonii TaxID=1323948 RepID=A0ABN8VUV3_9BACT|nr:sigma 54-interacting transcriptional regulator [Nitrospina watsonii]CAI2717580.1 Transcriptional regulator, sigma54-dependent [Nitrospina watsonii]
MNASPSQSQPFINMRELLLAMPQQRSVSSLLETVVEKSAEDPFLALTRIWLIRPGDHCATCPLQAQCLDQTRCLHLVAERYSPGYAPSEDLEDDYLRIPLGVGKVGRCAVTGEIADTLSLADDLDFAVSKRWGEAMQVIGLAVLPVVFQGKVLGVCGFVPLKEVDMEGEGLFWGRLVADHLAVSITNAEAFEQIETLNKQLTDDYEYLSEELVESQAFGDIIGQSVSLNAVLRQIEMVAKTDASILITGESGTGKELVAREVHKRGPRWKRPMIKVNCASIPRDLYESEFFGHLKGAFTGAVQDRKGRFELANGGTLFLDEVGEIPLEVQSKLLRVLQEGEYERVGDERTRTTDVRILAATNRDLKREVKEGRFREDLYYRLNVFPIELPPLRERTEDIPLLALHFIEAARRKFNQTVKPPSRAVLSTLQKYSWPGNIRELQNLVERAVITSAAGRLKFDLPGVSEPRESAAQPVSQPAEEEVIPEAEMRKREKENILRALQQAGGKIYGDDGAAKRLDIKPTTLATRIKAMGLKKQFLPE